MKVARSVFLLVVALIACADRLAGPRSFTFGPGCWTRETADMGGGVTMIVDRHHRTCPIPLPDGAVLLHWDTVFASH